MVKYMNTNPIIFALASPIPDISKEDAKQAGVYIYATNNF